MSKMLEEPVVDVEEVPPAYFVELSKSGRAECKKCDCKIENKSLRVGVMIDGEWGLLTRWQHLDCTVFPKAISSVDMIDGFQELNAENKKLVIERFDASANEVDDDTVPVNPDELVRKAWDQPLEPSSDLLMPLLPYQKEGLGWMVSQEQNEVHGGILADEMGMGKIRIHSLAPKDCIDNLSWFVTITMRRKDDTSDFLDASQPPEHNRLPANEGVGHLRRAPRRQRRADASGYVDCAAHCGNSAVADGDRALHSWWGADGEGVPRQRPQHLRAGPHRGGRRPHFLQGAQS